MTIKLKNEILKDVTQKFEVELALNWEYPIATVPPESTTKEKYQQNNYIVLSELNRFTTNFTLKKIFIKEQLIKQKKVKMHIKDSTFITIYSNNNMI